MGETNTRFRASADIAARDILDGLMLVNLTTGAAFKLNRVGAAVWKRLDGNTDVSVIVADLCKHYSVGMDSLQRDVDTLLADLERQGLIGRSHQP